MPASSPCRTEPEGARTVSLEGFQNRLRRLLRCDERPEEERERLVRLMLLWAGLPPPSDPDGNFPFFEEYRQRFVDAASGRDPEALEASFLRLYEHVHMHEAPYTKEERSRMDAAGGYWAHAGGLSPILKAGPFINPQTVSADLGAGNGLQGLLLQVLDPHRKTIQVEISSRMVEIGKGLQAWLGVADERVQWVVGDLCSYSIEEVDFVYLYRPLRPTTEEGSAFYRTLAQKLEHAPRNVVIFSIADCLRSFLSSRFSIFHTDGHLTCFTRE